VTTAPPPALQRLVGDAAHFTAHVFGRRPLDVPRAAANAFADLLCLDDVDHLVTSSGLRAPAFRVVQDGRTLSRAEVTRRVRIGSRPVDDLIDVAAVQRAFADGATIVLQSLHRSWHPVTRFCQELEGTLTHAVQANAYLTPPVAQGLHLHADQHDVFAVQTHGSKRWVVHPPDEDAWDLELRPGDVLYLPAGTRHAAQTRDDASLHLTIGVRTQRWDGLVRRVAERALEAAGLDDRLPAGWADDPGKLQAELEERIAALRSALERQDDLGAILDAAAETFHADRVPDRSGALRDVLAAPGIDDDTTLRARAGFHARIERHHGRGTDVVHLVLTDRRLELPDQVAPVLERLLTGAPFRPSELDALIDLPSRLVLCRRLVREGWLTVARPQEVAPPAAGPARA
jgi:bifunctional lysine-specific demethylase and histidyl-hydroxylase NO66